MNMDAYGEITNGPMTFRLIADMLRSSSSVPCIIGWTDEQLTHYDILFTLSPFQAGLLQGGMRGPGNLYVSIMRLGSFGFAVRTQSPGRLTSGYVGEKLNVSCKLTSQKLSELINGVMDALVDAAP